MDTTIAKELNAVFNGPDLKLTEVGRIACALVAQVPAWLHTTPDTLKMAIETIEELGRGSGQYRAYAKFNCQREVIGVDVQPWWVCTHPGLNFEKIGDFEV